MIKVTGGTVSRRIVGSTPAARIDCWRNTFRLRVRAMTIRFHRGDLPDLSRFRQSVAIDTETQGLNPHRDRLCLVQLSPGDGNTHLVQMPRGPHRAPRLAALIAD